MLVDFGKAGLIEKARQQPDKVRMVLDKVRTDGLMPTLEAVRNKLDQPLPMGYCNVGEVVEVGAGVQGFAVGDRVASNGKHAEMVAVPVNLCARVPDAVPDEAAAFTVLGAIALQGIRLAQPTLGEAVVVTGLGLIGLVTVQLLRAQGCRVLGLLVERRRDPVAAEVDLVLGVAELEQRRLAQTAEGDRLRREAEALRATEGRLTRDGLLIEDPEQPGLELEPTDTLDHLNAASIRYRIAIGGLAPVSWTPDPYRRR